jgi:hypothetical protein
MHFGGLQGAEMTYIGRRELDGTDVGSDDVFSLT